MTCARVYFLLADEAFIFNCFILTLTIFNLFATTSSDAARRFFFCCIRKGESVLDEDANIVEQFFFLRYRILTN